MEGADFAAGLNRATFMPTDTIDDSRPDTLAHINRVQTLIQTVVKNLSVRAAKHDLSKLD